MEEKPPPQPDQMPPEEQQQPVPPPQAHQQQPTYQPQAPMQHPHGYIGFGMDPNWASMHVHHAGAPQGYPQLPPGAAPMDGSMLPPGILPDAIGDSLNPLDHHLGVFPCARLRGLPFNASIEDVMIFFRDLVLLDIVVVPSGDDDRKGTGEAFVLFSNLMEFQMALQRDRQTMGHRYIEVFQGSRADYHAAIASQYWQNKENQVAMGKHQEELALPEEVRSGPAWGGSGPPPAQGLGNPAPQSRPGEAVVGGNGVIGEMRKGGTGARGGQGIRTEQGGMGPTGTRGPSHRGGGIREGEHTGFLRMRGLPFSASKEDVIEFFKGYDPVMDSICLTVRSDGRATGEGYVAFNSPEDAKKAMSLHRNTMGSRYIELFISNKDEHTRAMSRTVGR